MRKHPRRLPHVLYPVGRYKRFIERQDQVRLDALFEARYREDLERARQQKLAFAKHVKLFSSLPPHRQTELTALTDGLLANLVAELTQ